jgi:predicted transcriptional regulator
MATIKNADFLYQKMRDFFDLQLISSAIDLNIFEMLKNENLSLSKIMFKLNTDNTNVEFLLHGLTYHSLLKIDNNIFMITEQGKKLLNNTKLNIFIRNMTSTLCNDKITLYDKWSKYHETLEIPKMEKQIGNIPKYDYVCNICDIIMDFMNVQVLYAAIKNNIIEYLVNIHSAEELSKITKFSKNKIDMLLQLLLRLNIITNYFYLTDIGKLLLKENEFDFSLYYICDFMANETYHTWRNISKYFLTGKPCFYIKHGSNITDYMKCNRDRSNVFNCFLGERMKWINNIINTFHFEGNIIDIGGANGKLLRTIVDNSNNNIIKATLFELPEIINNIDSEINILNIHRHIAYIKGSFFDTIPKNYDTYFISRVMQDWNDEKLIQIFTNIHSAMNEHSKLIVLDECYSITPSKYDINAVLDLASISPEGTIRSYNELIHIFNNSGFNLIDEKINTNSDYKPIIFILKKK